MRLVSFFCFITLLITTQLSAQSNLFIKGTVAESKSDHTAARKYFQGAINQNLSLEDYVYITRYFLEQQYYADVSKPLHKAARHYQKKIVPLYLYHVSAFIALRQADSAQYYLNLYLQQYPATDKTSLLQQSIAQLPQFYIQDSVMATLLPDQINTAFNETYPSIAYNDSMLVFTRENSEGELDFYYSMLDTCNDWLYAKDLGSPPNSIKREQSHFLSADGRYMFFTRCGNIPTNDRALGMCDIYFAYKINDQWMEDVPFGATINTHAFEGMPSLSADQRTLYFVSDRPGGYGGKDIWYSKYEHGKWQVPVNLGPEINTPFDEVSPFIAPDGVSLYFSSNGHAGLGGFDLYYYSLLNKQVKNLGAGYNSPYDDISLVIDHRQSLAYFSSNRPSGYGGYDIYSMPILKEISHQLTTYWKGSVLDSVSGESLTHAYIEIWDMAGNVLAQYQSNSGDGSFIIPLINNQEYQVMVLRSGFDDVSFNVNLDVNTIHWNYNISMVPQDYVPEEIVPEPLPVLVKHLDPINFERNVRKLTIAQIEELRAFLQEIDLDKLKSITIHSYTDNSGTPAINMAYANERAVSAHHIIAEFIAPDKIVHRIWGDADPVAPNDTEENRYLNRRLEIVIELWVTTE